MHLGVISFVGRVHSVERTNQEIAIDIRIIGIDIARTAYIREEVAVHPFATVDTRNTWRWHSYILAIEIEILITSPKSRFAVVAIHEVVTHYILRFYACDSRIPTIVLQDSYFHCYIGIIKSEIFLSNGELYHLLGIEVLQIASALYFGEYVHLGGIKYKTARKELCAITIGDREHIVATKSDFSEFVRESKAVMWIPL